MARLIIVDDESSIRAALRDILEYEGYDIDEAKDGEEGLNKILNGQYDVALCDIRMPKLEGLDVLLKTREAGVQTPFVMVSAYGNVENAVEATKRGAFDFITKPPDLNRLLVTVRNALERGKMAEETKTLKKRIYKLNEIVGESAPIRKVKETIDRVAPTEARVLITGPNGSGKEMVAKQIHERGSRAAMPLIEVNCAAIPGELIESELFGHEKGAFTGAANRRIGKFEQADGGTLFLDEIGNLSYENQIKLLRVLQERKIKRIGSNQDISVDVRIICATNEDLRDAVRRGSFREDIFHRLDEFRIELVPLRERKADIMIFADHFLELANQQLEKDVIGFDDEAKEKLKDYYWHGNLRELQNVVKRAVLLAQSDYITTECLPHEIISPTYLAPEEPNIVYVHESGLRPGQPPVITQAGGGNLKSVSENAERVAILKVLEKTGYNKTKAAEVLNIDRKTLYNKLKAYDIHL